MNTLPALVGEVVDADELAADQLVPLDVMYTPDRHPALVYLDSLGSSSVPTMRRSLDTIANLLTDGRLDHLTLPWHLLRNAHTSRVAGTVTKRYKPATAKKTLSALSKVIDTCWSLGYYDAETRDRTKAFKRPKGTRLRGAAAGRHVQPPEVQALYASCVDEQGALGTRDAAMLTLLYGAGLRREEAARLDLDHLDEADARLTVVGKGDKERTTYLDDDGMAALTDWLRYRGRRPGPLLVSVHREGLVHPRLRRLSPSGIYQALDRRARKAGVAKFSPHDMRRTYIGDMLDRKVDLATVAELVGHSSTDTTRNYDRRGERAKKAAARKLHVPYLPSPIREDGFP